MNESKATKAQNLARIRDNQRRSRARRKEYLQELEAKLRGCEQMGVEASAEIQSAARRVLEENRRLRAMLRTRGVPEAEIAAALGTQDKSLDHVSAAPALMSMLERRWTRTGMSPDDSNVDTQSESPSLISQASAVDLTPLSIPPQPILTRTAHDANSPASIISSTGTPPSFTSAPFFAMEMTPAPEIKIESVPQYGYQFDQNHSNSWIFGNNPNYSSEPVTYYNTSSCVGAANIIRTMRSDVGTELDASLGCHTPDRDCRIPNPNVYNVMDRYSNHNVRM